ncbi:MULTISPECIES: hypothetical protein [Morganellaceae]|uniref:Uncharacterized protein n=1 Tax=Providencia huashanensis TaxID=3037798 RepID=A0ABT9AUH2_9GAMM|nr:MULTISPECIES: hypothetical protein [Morganellaceae]MBZ3682195.1 hypothetical protein [Providencia rettgeri]MCU9564471.1 hypothetical protein [Proteus mirabilis]MDO7831732.1 hypothetical protein [Providencia sp. CRE-138-0026]MDO7858221.1 hypothetical protein [Providencia sp. CRE-138-0111]UII02262.1 hypothetical protein [Providencia rettgeri]
MQLRVTINDILCPELAAYLESCPPGKRSSALVALANRAYLEGLGREATPNIYKKGKVSEKPRSQKLAKGGKTGQNISSPVGTGLQSSYSENQPELAKQQVAQPLASKAVEAVSVIPGSNIESSEPRGAVLMKSEAGSENTLSVSVDTQSTERDTYVNAEKSIHTETALPRKRFRLG